MLGVSFCIGIVYFQPSASGRLSRVAASCKLQCPLVTTGDVISGHCSSRLPGALACATRSARFKSSKLCICVGCDQLTTVGDQACDTNSQALGLMNESLDSPGVAVVCTSGGGSGPACGPTADSTPVGVSRVADGSDQLITDSDVENKLSPLKYIDVCLSIEGRDADGLSLTALCDSGA